MPGTHLCESQAVPQGESHVAQVGRLHVGPEGGLGRRLGALIARPEASLWENLGFRYEWGQIEVYGEMSFIYKCTG